MSDPVEVMPTPSDRVRSVLGWVARMVTRVSMVGAVTGGLVWWNIAHDRVGEWPGGTIRSALLLAVLLAPAGWLLNVRFALLTVRDLPSTLQDVARRRGPQMRDALGDPTQPMTFPSMRSTRGAVRDYGDVTGSWAAIAQLMSPGFWLLTGLAFLGVAVLGPIAAISTLARLVF